MKQIEKALLGLLINYQKKYITSHELASELSLSDRTIRKYMVDVKEKIEKNGAKIIAKQGQGYQLAILKPLAFAFFLKHQNIAADQGMSEMEFFETEDRQKYLLNKLLLEDEAIFMDELESELFISRSSLSNDLNEIKAKIEPYALKICSKPRQGMWIEGSEQNKRHFIMDTFFGDQAANSLKDYLVNSHFFNEFNFEEVLIIILDEIREANLKVSDFIMQNLALHLALTIKRINEGFPIEALDFSEELVDRREYQVAKKIVQRMNRVTKVPFPEAEIHYLTLHLVAKSNPIEKINDELLYEELARVIEQLADFFGDSLIEDQQLKNGLLNHLTPMVVRLRQGITLENPLTEDIKKENMVAFEQTKRIFSQMPMLRQFTINEDEWAYLTLHIMAALEKVRTAKKIRVLIICATGYGSAQLLKNRVLAELGEMLLVTNVKGYYEINEMTLMGVDMIISSIDLSTMFFKIPVLHVSVFLNPLDSQKIRQTIADIQPCPSKRIKTICTDSPKKRQDYHGQLSERWYKVYSERPTKETVILDLLSLLEKDEVKDYTLEMMAQISKREKMGQIVFSETVAVPHPAIPVGVTTKIAVAVIPEGMFWDDYQQIKFVFLVSPSFIENEEITIVTKAIVQLIDRTDLQQQILIEPTFENFSNHFDEVIE
ncbi:BglG family transcription antiterminator [Enterococcus hirae]|nr:BglG family transcription antiterminator [Enterococcus hirae]